MINLKKTQKLLSLDILTKQCLHRK